MSFVRDRYDNGSTRTGKSLVDTPGNLCSKNWKFSSSHIGLQILHRAGMEGGGGKVKSGVVGGPVTYER